jgi:putative salt-induced outer membrane protein YdiY
MCSGPTRDATIGGKIGCSVAGWHRSRSDSDEVRVEPAGSRHMNMRIVLGAAAGLLFPSLAFAAQPPEEPEGTVKAAPASAGVTELEGAGEFGKAADVDAAKADDATELDLSAGGLFSTGNARALSLTSTGNFRIRRKIHQFGAQYAGNYGRAAVDRNADPQVTVGNIQGRLRYDVFVHSRISLFAMATARHDPFQGLVLRLNIDPGVAFYVLNDPKHRLWAEVGYDYQYDYRTEDTVLEKDEDGNVVLDAMGNPNVIADRVRPNHAARLFGGYANNINEHVTFGTGVEYLQSFLGAERWRLNWDTGLTVSLVQHLAIAATFTVRVDHDPAPNIEKVDTITAFSLVYRFF